MTPPSSGYPTRPVTLNISTGYRRPNLRLAGRRGDLPRKRVRSPLQSRHCRALVTYRRWRQQSLRNAVQSRDFTILSRKAMLDRGLTGDRSTDTIAAASIMVVAAAFAGTTGRSKTVPPRAVRSRSRSRPLVGKQVCRNRIAIDTISSLTGHIRGFALSGASQRPRLARQPRDPAAIAVLRSWQYLHIDADLTQCRLQPP